jgi:TP901 family phage tail tape measure protein
MLARQTLQLAAANGRGAQEAAEAAVSWARLGLTRSQVLMTMETSLRAANVAEISTADATKYLSAQYKAFNQTLADIPANLDYINSLSNKLNVTPENIMQGIARTATVARAARGALAPSRPHR